MEASITLEQNSISNDEKKFINFLNERRIKDTDTELHTLSILKFKPYFINDGSSVNHV